MSGFSSVKKYAILVLCMSAFSLFGCAGSGTQTPEPTKYDSLPEPTKDILVTQGDLNKPYNILGKVECSIDGKSIYANYDDIGKEIERLCKKVAFSKYGKKVDAIVNMDISLNVNGGMWGQMGAAWGARNSTASGAGIAVHFK